MIKKIFKNTVLGAIALIMSTTSVLAADMVIGVPNWPTANATANILKLAIEQNLGLDVELQSGTNPIFFEEWIRVLCMSTLKFGCLTNKIFTILS